MVDADTQSLPKGPGAVTLRPEQPGDEPFLLHVYAGTREEEWSASGWDATTRAALLDLQFRAMRQGYRSAYPHAEFSVVLEAGEPVGRMVVNRTDAEIRLVDLALLPGRRGRGIGEVLVKELCAESGRARKPVRLQVFLNNRARRLYERLGFIHVGGSELYEEMEWRPGGG